MPETAAEQAVWTVRKGDDWRVSFTTTDTDVDTWDDTTLEVVVRDGANEDATLLYSSIPGDVTGDVKALSTTGTDFDSATKTLVLHIQDADTTSVTSDMWIHARCEIGGHVETILFRRLYAAERLVTS